MFYFCITWLPTYLQERHGFDATTLGFFAGLPLLVSVPSDLFGGVVTDQARARATACASGAARWAPSPTLIAGLALFVAARRHRRRWSPPS